MYAYRVVNVRGREEGRKEGDEAREKNRLNYYGFICKETPIDASRLLYGFHTGEYYAVGLFVWNFRDYRIGIIMLTFATSPTATASGAFELKPYKFLWEKRVAVTLFHVQMTLFECNVDIPFGTDSRPEISPSCLQSEITTSSSYSSRICA